MKVAAECSVPQQTESVPANPKQNPFVEEKHGTPVFAHCGPYLHGSLGGTARAVRFRAFHRAHVPSQKVRRDAGSTGGDFQRLQWRPSAGLPADAASAGLSSDAASSRPSGPPRSRTPAEGGDVGSGTGAGPVRRLRERRRGHVGGTAASLGRRLPTGSGKGRSTSEAEPGTLRSSRPTWARATARRDVRPRCTSAHVRVRACALREARCTGRRSSA